MSKTITVYLVESFGNIEEDNQIKVYVNELWAPADASMRGYKSLVEVYDDNEDKYFVNEDIIQEISDRMF